MVKKGIIILIVSCFTGFSLMAQELDCRIQISYSKIQETSNRQKYQEMQSAVYEFMNNTIWTNHVVKKDERIECNIRIELKEKVSADEYKGSIQVQSSRIAYNSSYNSPVFKHLDKDLRIQYVEFEPLEFSLSSHQSNFTSILAFYAYIIIGMDYDTFGMQAGTPFFQKAEQIVQNAQTAQEVGWKAYESTKNRYWLVHDLLHDTYTPLREAMYIYHRQGLDRMHDKPVEGRTRVEDAIMELKDVHNKRPGSFLMSVFVDAKSEEIVNIFSEGFPDQKNRVVRVMEEIDPANASKYQKILKEE